jgi:hypothetical protein
MDKKMVDLTVFAIALPILIWFYYGLDLIFQRLYRFYLPKFYNSLEPIKKESYFGFLM